MSRTMDDDLRWEVVTTLAHAFEFRGPEPYPGSPAIVRAGCVCPVIFNMGRNFPWFGVAARCPLHGVDREWWESLVATESGGE